jgi:phosphatidylglycerophosphatase C
MKPGIAFFDFDGTITRRDTLFEIVKFVKGSGALYRGLLVLSPALVLMKLKVLDNETVKQLFLKYFFRNMSAQEFSTACADFCVKRLPALIRPDALEAIRSHQQQGHLVSVVTASAGEWVQPWCTAIGIGCIATNLEIINTRITGKIKGENCNGPEKVRRIREQYDLTNYGEIYAYGDTNGDRPLLGIATHPFFRKFVQ